MTCNFRVGQRVVCIDAVVWSKKGFPLSIESGLTEGTIYTVAAVRFHPHITYGKFPGEVGGYALDIVGHNPSSQWANCTGFNAKRFRPVVTRPTSIEIFTRMLNPTRIGVPA